jgi:hypothetical protein
MSDKAGQTPTNQSSQAIQDYLGIEDGATVTVTVTGGKLALSQDREMTALAIEGMLSGALQALYQYLDSLDVTNKTLN